MGDLCVSLYSLDLQARGEFEEKNFVHLLSLSCNIEKGVHKAPK